jgi:hypothetical protein
MNSHNHRNHDPFDVFIGRSIKNWLGRHHPPEDAKEKLLRAASMDSLERTQLRELWWPFLQQLTLRITTLLTPNQERTPFSVVSQNTISGNSDYYAWGLHQTMIRSYPAGSGLLSFLC